MQKLISRNAHLFILTIIPFSAIFTTHPVKWLLVILALLSLRKNILGVLKKNPVIILSWILYLIYCGVSLVWTVSVPISLVGLLDQIGYFLYFIYVLIICDRFGRMQVFRVMCIYIVTLITINISLILSPIRNQIGGSTDFLLPVYGHNHLSSLVLLVLPAAFYLINKKSNRLGVILIIFLLTSLISSSGRILLFFGLTEIIVTFILLTKINSNLTHKAKALFAGSLLVIPAIICWFLVLSTKAGVCNESQSRWCKPLDIGARKSYISVAVKNLAEKPLLGSGLNTYSLIARKYAEQSGVYSYYAHNYLLQLTTELGAFGFLVFTLLFTTILAVIRSGLSTIKNSSKLERFLVIGLLFNFFNSLLDYDWNITASFLLTVMVLAIVISKSNENVRKFDKSLFITKICSYLQVAIRSLLYLLLFFIVMFVTQSVLIAIKKPDYACSIFAGNKYVYELLLSGKNGEISINCLKKIEKYFFNDLSYWQYKNDNSKTESDRINAHFNLLRLSPWHTLAGSILDYYIENDESETAKEYIDLVIENIRQLKKTNSLKPWQLYKPTLEIVKYGNYLFLQNKYDSSGVYHRIAYEIDPWALSYLTPIITDRVAVDKNEDWYYEYLKSVPPEYFRNQARYYSDYYLTLAIELGKANSGNNRVLDLIKSASRMTDTINVALWYRLLWTIEGDDANPLTNYENYAERTQIFQVTDEMVQILKRNPNKLFYNELNRAESQSIAKYLTNLSRISLTNNQIDLAYNLAWSATRFIDVKSPVFSQNGLLCENVMNLTCAEREYRNCLAISKQQNQACYAGLIRVTNNNPDINKYWSITQKLFEN